MNISIIKKITVFIIVIIRMPALYAQDSLTFALSAIAEKMDGTQLTIGETMPAIMLQKIVNGKSDSIKFTDLKGKMVILDFWHQYCTVCLKEFPKLTALQQQFGDSIMILPVTFQSKTSVIDFLHKRADAGKALALPSVVEDTILHKLFPHAGDPFEVWIDKNGKVCATTNHLAVTEENISKWLRTGIINLPVKKDLMDFDPDKPLLVNNNGGPDSAFLFRSLFTNYLEGLHGGGYMANETTTTTRICIQNQTMESMYKVVYGGLETSPLKDMNDLMMGKRMIFETKDSSRNNYWTTAYNKGNEEYLHFCRKHIFSFDLILPSRIHLSNAYKMAILDMDAFFGIASSIEKRKIKCLALTRIAGHELNLSNAAKDTYKIDEESSTINFGNKSISFIVEKINSNFDMPIIIDETRFKLNIDMTLKYKNVNPDVLNKYLKQYGLELIEKEYLLDVLVLKDVELK